MYLAYPLGCYIFTTVPYAWHQQCMLKGAVDPCCLSMAPEMKWTHLSTVMCQNCYSLSSLICWESLFKLESWVKCIFKHMYAGLMSVIVLFCHGVMPLLLFLLFHAYSCVYVISSHFFLIWSRKDLSIFHPHMSTGSPSHSHVEKILNRQGVGRFDRLSYTAALYLAIQICTQLSLPNGSWTFQCH